MNPGARFLKVFTSPLSRQFLNKFWLCYLEDVQGAFAYWPHFNRGQDGEIEGKIGGISGKNRGQIGGKKGEFPNKVEGKINQNK